MKSIISNRVYLHVDKPLENSIKEELTYSIPSYTDPTKPTIIRNYGIIRPGLMSLPVGRTDLIPEQYTIVDKRVLAPVDFPEFRFKLRESQQAVHDEIDDNALINAKVSWGKTFTGIAIAGKLGQKTLVAVHTIPLMNQWAKEVEKAYGFKPGMIGGGHENFSTPIVIGNVRSLYTRMDRLCKEFGTIIMDEVHHAPMPSFSKIIDRSFARYKIGLSGTLERKDGKHVVLTDYFSSKVFKPPKENCMTPIVHAINTGLSFPDNSDGWANRVTQLQESYLYRNLIVSLAQKYAEAGHKIMIVSDRTDFLKYVANELDAALIIGDTKDRDAEFTKLDNGNPYLVGTQSILSEGISYDPLSCLIPCTPINNMPLLEQLIGRIIRLCPGKPQPIALDLRLKGWSVQRQFTNRQGFYMREGYDIVYL